MKNQLNKIQENWILKMKQKIFLNFKLFPKLKKIIQQIKKLKKKMFNKKVKIK